MIAAYEQAYLEAQAAASGAPVDDVETLEAALAAAEEALMADLESQDLLDAYNEAQAELAAAIEAGEDPTEAEANVAQAVEDILAELDDPDLLDEYTDAQSDLASAEQSQDAAQTAADLLAEAANKTITDEEGVINDEVKHAVNDLLGIDRDPDVALQVSPPEDTTDPTVQ
ncbi:MAG: YlbF family regulator [Sedimenticola sp.]